MKLIIDINDNEYIGIKEYPNNVTSYPVTIHIYDAIRNGTPLSEELKKELEKIRRESIKLTASNIMVMGTRADGRMDIIDIIDKHLSKLKGE